MWGIVNIFLLLLFDAKGQGKSAMVKTLVQVRSLPVPFTPAPLHVLRQRPASIFKNTRLARCVHRRPPQRLSFLLPVVHVTKVRPLADRVREVQQQMSAALLTGVGDASAGASEGQAADCENGGSKRGREHTSGEQ